MKHDYRDYINDIFVSIGHINQFTKDLSYEDFFNFMILKYYLEEFEV